jgi:tetratricopeptide (TPR) repeat protein/TolB-like protein
MHISLRINRVRALGTAAVMIMTFSAAVFAQCPDGTPAPCRSGVRPNPAARRPNPALNSRAWIVVPFGNVMKAQDLDWLRDASVNLLSMDMSRWTDIQVVPDKRVGDLMRELPASAATLTLNDGLTLARRAGAGMLVMGDFFRLGKGARIVANVFDVRTGAKVRSATRETGEPDSLLTAFTPLARGLLDVPPPAGARTGDLGTTSIDAYQEFLLGDRALNRFDLEGAQKHLRRALELDSTFALAHLRLSYALVWGEQSNQLNETKLHALAAQRLGAQLPPRERALIAGQVAMVAFDYGRACDVYAPLVARDSTDVEAMYMLGDCSYHDAMIRPLSTDSTRGVFRSSWNSAVRLLSRVLELDPNYHQAFEHVLDILRADSRGGCLNMVIGESCNRVWAIVLRDADTLRTQPIRSELNRDAYFADVERAAKDNSLGRNLDAARRVAQNWVDADPSSSRAHTGLARVFMAQGRLDDAYAQLRLTSRAAFPGNFMTLRAHIEVDAKVGHGAESRAAFDSLIKAIPDGPGVYQVRGTIELMYGRLRRFRIYTGNVYKQFGPPGIAYGQGVPLTFLGIPPADMAAREAAFFSAITDTACSIICRRGWISPTLEFGMRIPRETWAAFKLSSSQDTYEDAARAIAAHDTAMLRRAAILYDSVARRDTHASWSDDGTSVMAADAFLALGDSTAALKIARFYVDSALAFQPLFDGVGGSNAAWIRMMLVRADLAAAIGSRDEAIKWYDRVLDLWADADLEFAPVIERIRATRAALAAKR